MHFSSAVCRTVSILTAFMLLASSAVANDGEGIGITQVIGTTASATTGAFQDFSGQSFRLRVDAKDLKGVSATNAKFVADKSTKFLERTRSRARSVGNSGALKFAGAALLTGDVMVDVLARVDGGDLQGAIAGGGALAGGMGFISGVSYISGLAGAAVATAVPVIGPVLGPSIGGAVGSVAGGFLAATAYDLLMKDNVGEALEETIAPLFDQRSQRVIDFLNRLRLQAAMDLKPYLERDYTAAGGSSPREVDLLPLPTLVVLPPTPSASSLFQPELPPEVIALTSFDARPIEATTVMAEGSVFHSTRDEWNAAFDDRSLGCNVLSIRDGHFFHHCLNVDNHAWDSSNTHVEIDTFYLGVVQGNVLSGSFLTWQRNHNFNSTDRDDVEYMRVFGSGRISGTIDTNGQIAISIVYEHNQVFDNQADWVNDYLHYTGEWKARVPEQFAKLESIEIVYEIVGTAEQGTLMLPNLTAADIRDTEFELPDVFFQHGVSPPERVR
ncbi:MAG: hypothetical protein RJQ10_15920 [Haliea sp.]|uniref:hypothetical protein n=1 Tax=Haliea sp. TaxID=1932666 RepID=UPI0032EDB7A7